MSVNQYGNGVREDPRVTRTRDLIEQSFHELLREKSLHALTIGDIAERARINRATFYAHFEDKYHLYRHTVQSIYAQILQANLSVTGDDKQGQLRALIAATCTFFEQLNSTCPPVDRQSRPLVEVEVQRQVYDFVLGWLRAHVTVEAIQPATPEVCARMVGWAIWGAALDWEESQQPMDGLVEQIFAVVAKMTPR